MQYFKFVDVGNIRYSIDKIRFNFSIDHRKADFVFSLLRDLNYEFFESFKSFQYKNLFKIHTANGNSFSLGIGFNSASHSERLRSFVEFNPNKVANDRVFLLVFGYLVRNLFELDLSLYDLAIDIPYNKKFVSLVKDRRVHKKFVYDAVGSNVTEYLGQSSDCGRVKLYNKSIESDLDYDLTRLELTTSSLDYLVVAAQLPKLLVCGDFDMLATTKLSKSDYVLLQLLWQSNDPAYYFKQLGRDKQDKLRPFVSSHFSLGFTEDVFNKLSDIVCYFKNKLNFE